MDEKKLAAILAVLMKNASEIFEGLEGFKNGKLTVEADGEKEHLVIVITKDKTLGLKMNIELQPLEKATKEEIVTPTEAQETITTHEVIEKAEDISKAVSESTEEEGEKEEEVFFL